MTGPLLDTPAFRGEDEKKRPSREWLPGSQRKKVLQGKRMINCVKCCQEVKKNKDSKRERGREAVRHCLLEFISDPKKNSWVDGRNEDKKEESKIVR